MDHQLYIQLAYALGIGLLVGLERTLQQVTESSEGSEEQPGGNAPVDEDAEPPADSEAREEREKQKEARAQAQSLDEFMGLRTFAVLSLLGFGAALVGEQVPFLGPVVVGGVCLLVVAMYIRVVQWGTGITTEAAAIAVCVLGMLCRYNAQAAGVIALVLAVLLASKRFTHGTARKMRRVELTDTLKFLVVILIVLPLLPNHALDPYGAFNPYTVGFLVVLISGISFVGYFLTRILGAQRGLGLTGILGGLTSSTAVTAAMAAQAKQQPKLRSICAFSTVAANATMFARVLVVVAVLDRALVMRLAWSIGAMTGVAIIASVVLWFIASKATKADAEAAGEIPLKNPFSVGPALKFAAFFVGILFVAKLSKLYAGDQGLYAAAALSGLADVDAITLTITEQTRNASLAQHVGAVGITIAVVSNSVVKTGIAIYSGGWKFGRLIGVCLGLATVAGLAVVFLVP
jgi:uncharacterized membrane protein (DUF4010 family)